MLPDELQAAHTTATRFLEEHCDQIGESLAGKMRFLEVLIQRLSRPNATLDQRLEYFARISEIAKLIQEDADGFFHLASRPVVARILAGVPQK